MTEELMEGMNAMYHELLGTEPDSDGKEQPRLDFEDWERDRLKLTLDNLNLAFEGRPSEGFGGDVYATALAAAEACLQDILGIQAKYERWQNTLELMEKRERKKLDAQLSVEKNPATSKGWTRDAIGAVIEGDEQVGILGDRRLECAANINWLRKLYDLYKMHNERIVNTNVNARRAWEANQ